jgi:hypothetical protein
MDNPTSPSQEHEPVSPIADSVGRVYRRAGISLAAVVAGHAGQIGVAMLTARDENLTPEKVYPTILANVVFLAALLWFSYRVSMGKNIFGALAMLSFLLIGALMSVAIVLSKGFEGTRTLLIAQGVYFVVWLVSFVLVSIAANTGEKKQAGRRPTK